jgi:crossover junction endodeoxyribonuclease RuvC
VLIIGLDPGSLNFGYGVIRAQGSDIYHITHGVIKNASSDPMPDRIFKISRQLSEVFQEYRPQYAVVEKIFLAKNADSAFKLGHVRGVAILEAMKAQSQVSEYAAREVKKGISGFGGSDKSQIRFMVRHLLGLPDLQQYDAADALALAIFHSQRVDIARKIDFDFNL